MTVASPPLGLSPASTSLSGGAPAWLAIGASVLAHVAVAIGVAWATGARPPVVHSGPTEPEYVVVDVAMPRAMPTAVPDLAPVESVAPPEPLEPTPPPPETPPKPRAAAAEVPSPRHASARDKATPGESSGDLRPLDPLPLLAEPQPTATAGAPVAPPQIGAEAAPRRGHLGTATGPAAETSRESPDGGPRDAAPAIGLSKGELKAYAKGVRARMEKHRRYPLAALRLGLEGTVKIKLSIDRAGRLANEPEIVSSSGHAVLDEEALRVVSAAAPYAALPAEANKDVVVLVVPIEFEIDEP